METLKLLLFHNIPPIMQISVPHSVNFSCILVSANLHPTFLTLDRKSPAKHNLTSFPARSATYW